MLYDSWTAESFCSCIARATKTSTLKCKLLQKAKTNFNLVANDYNSDENTDNESKTTTAKPLFASLSSTVSLDPSSVKIYSLKTDLPTNVKAKGGTTEETDANVVEKPTATKSKANTFASIITGGRSSPNEQESELIELMKLEVAEANHQHSCTHRYTHRIGR